MRWLLLAACCCSIVCSVSLAQKEGGKPTLQVITKATTFNLGERKALYCEGKFLEDDLEWYNPAGDKIPKRSNKSKRVYVEYHRGKDTNIKLLALLIHSMALEDTGTYTCQAGDLSDKIDIFVGEKVVMSTAEEDYLAEEGHVVDMSCQAKGTPQPEIQWYKDNKILVTSERHKVWYKPKISTGYLKISGLNYSDSGTYICKATQEKISHFAEKACNLSVQHKPFTEYSAKEVYAILGEWKSIICEAIANPLPNFTWSRRNNNTYDEHFKGVTDGYKVTSNATSSVLTLHITNDTLEKQYKCSIENPKGRRNIVFHVSLGNKPDPPSEVTAVSSTANNITFSVSCKSCVFDEDNRLAPNPENLTVLGYVFEIVEYKEGYEDPYWVNATTHQFDIAKNNGTTMFTIEGLTKATKYYVRVATRNLAGLSDWFTLSTNPQTTDAATTVVNSFALLTCALIASYFY